MCLLQKIAPMYNYFKNAVHFSKRTQIHKQMLLELNKIVTEH